MKWQAWAYVDEDNEVIADTIYNTEIDVWGTILNRPDNPNIEAAKARGCRVVLVTIEEIEE